MKTFFKVIALVLCVSLILPICSVFSFAANSSESLLTIVKQPDRVDFYEGLDWGYNLKGEIGMYHDPDISGTILEYKGEQIRYYVFPWGPNMYCIPQNGDWVLGENEAYIVIDDFDDDVCVPLTIYLHTVVDASFETPPDVTHYVRGIDWNYNEKGEIVVNEIHLEGLTLKVDYSDGTTKHVQNENKIMTINWAIIDDYFTYKLGYNEFYATFCGREFVFGFYIELEGITGVSAAFMPTKSSYDFNKDWFSIRGKARADIDLNGLAINVKYNNKNSEIVRYKDCPEKFQLAPDQTLTPGFNRIHIIYDSKYDFFITISLLMMGDVDFDGMLNSSDALLVLKHTVGSLEFDGRQLPYADVNDDGQINSADALCIQSKAVGLISTFDAEL